MYRLVYFSGSDVRVIGVKTAVTGPTAGRYAAAMMKIHHLIISRSFPPAQLSDDKRVKLVAGERCVFVAV